MLMVVVLDDPPPSLFFECELTTDDADEDCVPLPPSPPPKLRLTLLLAKVCDKDVADDSALVLVEAGSNLEIMALTPAVIFLRYLGVCNFQSFLEELLWDINGY
jgi:hypothetical protein